MVCLKISHRTAIAILLVMTEMTKCLHDEMQWVEWCRCCDVTLGYYWPSDNTSEGSTCFRWSWTRVMTVSLDGCQKQKCQWLGKFNISYHRWPWVTETTKSKTAGKWRLVHNQIETSAAKYSGLGSHHFWENTKIYVLWNAKLLSKYLFNKWYLAIISR